MSAMLQFVRATALAMVVVLVALASPAAAQEKVLRLSVPTGGPRTLDPAYGTSVYDNMAASQVYETLLEFNYFTRPETMTPDNVLQPLLLAKMPEISADGTTFRFTLRDDIYYTDDACFPGGKGRRMTPDDVFYSWKRLADPAYSLQAWPDIEGLIVGLDAYKVAQNDAVTAGQPFNYDAPVEGLRRLSDTEFEVQLTRPDKSFIWKIATFRLSIVCREAVEHYGKAIDGKMVGTGPFMLKEWQPKTKLVFVRNPNYRDVRYPEAMDEFALERGWDEAAGQKLPLVDRLEYNYFIEDQPRWLEFKVGRVDVVFAPDLAFAEVFQGRSKRLRPEWKAREVDYQPIPLLDFIYRGFNMEDPVIGGYTPEKVALRRAISLALNWEEMNDSLYGGFTLIYDGPVPPGVDGYPPDGRLPDSNRGPDLPRARQILQEAGFTLVDGKVTGVPPLDMWTAQGVQSQKIVELFQRNLEQIGIALNPRYVDFPTLTEALDKKQCQMFSLAWASAYPAAEYSFQLFYGPNEAPGPNQFNFKNAEFDELFQKINVLPPGDERSAAYARMQEILVEFAPFAGSQARVRQYLIHPWVKNYWATEMFYNFTKYIDVDMTHPDRGQ